MAVTLRDIAKRLNLSHATVSFVLNDRRDVAIPESTRKRVLEMAKEMGYRPNRAARALVMGKTNVLGVWIPTVRHRYYAEVLDALNEAARQNGYEILYHRADFDNPNLRPIEWPIDGIIAVDVRDILEARPIQDSMPLISVGAFVDRRYDHVIVDLEQGTYEVVAHLIERAGRRILHVKSNERLDGRDTGYSRALAAAEAEPENVICHGNDPRRVLQTVREYVRRKGLPGGIFAANDVIAMAVARGLAELGYHAPRDYVLAGFDGTYDSETMDPPLTTVCQPVTELGEVAIKMLQDRLQNPNAPTRCESLSPRLTIRESSQRHVRIVESA